MLASPAAELAGPAIPMRGQEGDDMPSGCYYLPRPAIPMRGQEVGISTGMASVDEGASHPHEGSGGRRRAAVPGRGVERASHLHEGSGEMLRRHLRPPRFMPAIPMRGQECVIVPLRTETPPGPAIPMRGQEAAKLTV